MKARLIIHLSMHVYSLEIGQRLVNRCSPTTNIIDTINNNNIYLKSNFHKVFSRLLYNTHIKYSIK